MSRPGPKIALARTAKQIAPWSACPTTKGGEALAATVVEREGTRLNAEEPVGLVKARKGSAHALKHIKFVNELPMTGVGEVDKKVLRVGFWAVRDRMVG